MSDDTQADLERSRLHSVQAGRGDGWDTTRKPSAAERLRAAEEQCPKDSWVRIPGVVMAGRYRLLADLLDFIRTSRSCLRCIECESAAAGLLHRAEEEIA